MMKIVHFMYGTICTVKSNIVKNSQETFIEISHGDIGNEFTEKSALSLKSSKK